MKNHALIAGYADVLAGALSYDRSLARRVRQEVEEHLWEAVAAESTADRVEAQRHVIAKFGDPHAIAARFAAVSLAKRARKLAAIAIIVIGGAYALMKARLMWYAAAQLVISGDLQTIGSTVTRIDGYAFWLSVVIGIAAWAYIGSRRIPSRFNPDWRRELRLFIILCGVATATLIASVIGDAILTGLRMAGTGWSPAFLLPVALLAVEIAGVGALAFLATRAALRIRDFAESAAPAP